MTSKAGPNRGIPHRPRGGRPPRLYEALELAWTGLQGKKLGLMERTFVEATLENERRRRAARLRGREGHHAAVSTD